MNEQVGLRGKAWFKALTESDTPNSGDPNSVLATTAAVGNESALFLCVIPDKDSSNVSPGHDEFRCVPVVTSRSAVETIIGISFFRYAVVDCSFVLAFLCRLRWETLEQRRRGLRSTVSRRRCPSPWARSALPSGILAECGPSPSLPC
jgi:hypothetical protein